MVRFQNNKKASLSAVLSLVLIITITNLQAQESFLSSDVVINELMADNEASVMDSAGEYDDWIELYNNSDVTLDLSGWFMSDDANELNEWAFPQGVLIEANGFLIIWCDEDLEQDGLHADFKLSAGGETVYLCTPELEIMQEITYAEAVTDESYSRIPNGTGDFVWQTHTFNGPNSTSAVADLSIEKYSFSCFPVPANEYFYIQSDENETLLYKIFSISGQIVWSQSVNATTKVDTYNWPKGMYIVSNESGSKNKIIIQ